LSNTIYYLAWLAAGLVATAIASAVIARHLRMRVLRRANGLELAEALVRFSAWVASQRRAVFFQGDVQDGDAALQEVYSIQQQWFPELSGEAAQLAEVHERLIDFLRAQQMLRQKDAEAWLDSDHDERFMELWRLHRHVVQSLREKLTALADIAGDAHEPGSTLPA